MFLSFSKPVVRLSSICEQTDLQLLVTFDGSFSSKRHERDCMLLVFIDSVRKQNAQTEGSNSERNLGLFLSAPMLRYPVPRLLGRNLLFHPTTPFPLMILYHFWFHQARPSKERPTRLRTHYFFFYIPLVMRKFQRASFFPRVVTL